MRDDVDVLSQAGFIARVARNAADARALLASLVARFGGKADAPDTLSLCIALAKLTEGREAELRTALREGSAASTQRGTYNRPFEKRVEPSAEAVSIVEWIRAHRASGIVINEGVASFAIASREVQTVLESSR